MLALKYLLSIFAIASLISCDSGSVEQVFRISGTVTANSDGEKVYLMYKDHDSTIVDSAEIKNKKFFFSAELSEPRIAILCNNSKLEMSDSTSVIIYIEPSNIKVSLNADNLSTARITGSKSQIDFEKIRLLKKDVESARIRVVDSMRLLNKTVGKAYSHPELIELEKKLESLNKKEIDIEQKFIEENPNSYTSIELLYPRLKRRESDIKIINRLFSNLSPKIRKSIRGKELQASILSYIASDIGGMAPEISGLDNKDNKVLLSAMRGKYVLIDFWASWCGPCRDDFPKLKMFYSKYHPKGLEVLSISTDSDVAKWMKAIEDENIQNWIHIRNQGKPNNIEKDYLVTAIPVKILLDKSGKVIGRWRGGGPENISDLERTLQQYVQ